MGLYQYERSKVRLNSVPIFRRRMSNRHPELLELVDHAAFLRMAERDRIHVRVVKLPDRQHARTFVVGAHRFIRLNRSLSLEDRTRHGMHELCHIWRDHVIEGAYYSDELTGGIRCEFADIFAWSATTSSLEASVQLNLDFTF